LFSGCDPAPRTYDRSSWDYQIDPDGFTVVDPTLQHPRCVWNLLKQHVAQYTPQLVKRMCGTPKDKFLKVAAMVGEMSAPNKIMQSLYALGWTAHSCGAQNIRAMVVLLQLILGRIDMRSGVMNALRGHSDIHSLFDLGLMSELIPGYLDMPHDNEPDLATYMHDGPFLFGH